MGNVAHRLGDLSRYPLQMFVPPELEQRVAVIGQRVGCRLTVVRCWQNEGGRPVFYANVRGTLNETPELRIEIAGTICAESEPNRNDQSNLFLFANGDRIGLHDQPFKYLIGHGDNSWGWDYNDEGFDQFVTLDDSTFSQPIDDSMRIPSPDSEQGESGG